MSAKNQTSTAVSDTLPDTLTEAQRTAISIVHNFNSSKKNYVELEGTVLEKLKPSVTTKTDGKGDVISQTTFYKINFGFLGGSTIENVDADIYASAEVGDTYTLIGTIKTVAENREFKDRVTGEVSKYAATGHSLNITSIVRKDLMSYLAAMSK